MSESTSDVRDGMRIDWDVAIAMDDEIVLRADVFRPIVDGRYPVILSYGPYGKGLAFQDGNASAWQRMIDQFPEIEAGSTNAYQNWELVDPEKWVPGGYVVVRVDSRGAGRSPGFLDPWSPRETRDLYQCIEWAGVQAWSSGRVGLNGISYYAMNAWFVAAMEPPHLHAICVWEGAADYYRDVTHHGGIMSQFLNNLYPRAILRVQHGLGERGLRSRVTGELVSGPETLTDEELARNRVDVERWALDRPLDDADHRERSAAWERIVVPFLSTANWGGQGLHTRGNFEGFVRAASSEKWLEAHGHAHWVPFYTDGGVALQKRFFGRYLKGEDNGWDARPRVLLNVRHVDRFVERAEEAWPIPRTRWTRLYLRPETLSLDHEPPGEAMTIAYATMGRGLEFSTPPYEHECELTGPVAAKLFVSSKTADADLFLTLRLFDPDSREITFHGSNDPRTPIGIGWLRGSHRKLDPALTLPYRPYHTHDEVEPLVPDTVYELDVEIWPTSIVIPRGYRFALWIRGCDYENDGAPLDLPGVKYTLTGVGPFLHDNPADRPPAIFDTTVTLHTGPQRSSYLLVPVVEAASGDRSPR